MDTIVTLELDDEAVQLIREFQAMQGDDSYANHLAYKILELYETTRNG